MGLGRNLARPACMRKGGGKVEVKVTYKGEAVYLIVPQQIDGTYLR